MAKGNEISNNVSLDFKNISLCFTTFPCVSQHPPGNTGEEDDVICRGLVGHYSVGDWLLLKNIALVDCRGLELVSVDLELR